MAGGGSMSGCTNSVVAGQAAVPVVASLRVGTLVSVARSLLGLFAPQSAPSRCRMLALLSSDRASSLRAIKTLVEALPSVVSTRSELATDLAPKPS